MSHRVAFHQGLHSLRRPKQYSGTGVHHCLVIWTGDHLHTKWTVSICKGKPTRMNSQNLYCYNQLKS